MGLDLGLVLLKAQVVLGMDLLSTFGRVLENLGDFASLLLREREFLAESSESLGAFLGPMGGSQRLVLSLLLGREQGAELGFLLLA